MTARQPLGGHKYRRSVLAGFAAGAVAAVPVAAVPAGALAQAEDPHLSWWREIERLAATLDVMPEEDEDARKLLWQERFALEQLIVETPATTMAGLRAQAVAACVAVESTLDESGGEEVPLELQALRSIRDACDRLAPA